MYITWLEKNGNVFTCVSQLWAESPGDCRIPLQTLELCPQPDKTTKKLKYNLL